MVKRANTQKLVSIFLMIFRNEIRDNAKLILFYTKKCFYEHGFRSAGMFLRKTRVLPRLLYPKAVAVSLEAYHTCMSHRGASVPSTTRTIALRGRVVDPIKSAGEFDDFSVKTATLDGACTYINFLWYGTCVSTSPSRILMSSMFEGLVSI